MPTYRDKSFTTRTKQLADAANPTFAWASLLLPVLLAFAGVLVGTQQLLYVHIINAASWFGIAVFLAAILGPVLGGLSPETAAETQNALIPKIAFLALGVSLGTITSGTLLFHQYGLFSTLGNPGIPMYAMGLGYIAFLFGVFGPHNHVLKGYYELQSDNPRPEYLEAIGEKNAKLGIIDAALIGTVIYMMVAL